MKLMIWSCRRDELTRKRLGFCSAPGELEQQHSWLDEQGGVIEVLANVVGGGRL